MNKNLGFYIGTYFVAYYGLFILIGITIALFLAYTQVKKHKLNFDNYILLVTIATLFALIGAKSLYFILEYKNINIKMLSNLKYLNKIMSGGFVFYGALIGGILGFYISKKYFKINVRNYIETTVFVFPIVHAFGRLGCHTVGCCHGIAFVSPISTIYKNSLFAPNNIELFPVQLTESICNLIIAVILFKYSNRLKNYQGLYLYVILYSIVRFILEFLRGDLRRGLFLNISTSQYISLLLIFIFTIALSITKTKKEI